MDPDTGKPTGHETKDVGPAVALVALFRRASSDLWEDGPHAGWAFDSLRRTLRRALLLAVAVWQVVMLWSVANTPAPVGDRWMLGSAHVGLLLGALLARSDRFPAGLVLVLVYPVVLWDWAVTHSIEGVLAFAACWLTHLAAAATAGAVRGRRAILLTLVAAVVLPLGIWLINPDWGPAVPVAVGLTSLVIMAALRLGLPFLLDFADQADAEAAMAEDEIRTTAALRSASTEAAEDARILHDTVINTLGAIANGGAGITDLDAVRERCARDAELVEELQSRRAERDRRSTSMREIFDAPGLAVVRTGVDDAELRRLEQQLPAHVIAMIVRAASEVLQNTAKHAEVNRAIVDVRADDLELVITISDEGVGFDGRVPLDRGFARSVMSRAAEVGVTVVLDTSPGAGTAVTFRKRLGEPGEPLAGHAPQRPAERDVDEVVTTLRLRAGWLWAWGVTAVGFVIEPMNRRGELTASYPMLLMSALLLETFAWFSRDSDGRFPARVAVALAIGASVAFGLSMAAVDFGRTDVVFAQAIAPTAPLIVLVASNVGHRMLRASLGLFVATVVVMTAVVWQDSSEAASIIPVAGLACLGLAAAWLGLQWAIDAVGRDHQVAFASRVDAAVRVAADDVRRRWRIAGLHQSVELLGDIASARVDPSAAAIRAACAQEEAYLRQLTQLSPDVVRMGLWCARALHEGRQRDAQLVVRTGDVDAADEETATMLGTVLLSAVASIPRGALLSATIFVGRPADDPCRPAVPARACASHVGPGADGRHELSDPRRRSRAPRTRRFGSYFQRSAAGVKVSRRSPV